MNEEVSLLLVDDEPDVLEAFKMMLEESGYSVFTAANQKEALKVLKEYPIAVCLIDLKMKDENGIRVSRELKKADSFIKIIIITAHPTYETAIDAMKMGIFDYVSKTTDPREILKKIERALELRQSEIAAKKGTPGIRKRNIVLICNHGLIQGGIENFCRDNTSYHLVHSYISSSYLKHRDFNSSASLLLLCTDCCDLFGGGEPEKEIARLHTFFPSARFVIINCNMPDDEKARLINLGIRGFFPESISKEDMKKAFELILKGQFWVSREVTHKLLNKLLEKSAPAGFKKSTNIFNLSKREVEILQALASGLSNIEISEKFFISENTVKIHVNHIFKKLNVKSRTQAVMKALETNIV